MNCTVHGVAKTQTRLSDFHFHFLGQEVIFQNLVGEKKTCEPWKRESSISQEEEKIVFSQISKFHLKVTMKQHGFYTAR